MPNNGANLLNVEYKENIELSQAPRLSRSPHPYSRRRTNVLLANAVAGALAQSEDSTPTLNFYPRAPENEATYFDADHRKRRKHTSSSSDSGTEADDEKGDSLLRLPAPPSRWRKGLKAANGSGTTSPLLTPSYLDKEPRKLASEDRRKCAENLQSPGCTDEETIKLREKYVRRRRAELIRRVTETVLLGAIGFIACNSETRWLLHLWAKGLPGSSEIAFGDSHMPTALLSYAAVILGLYGLYPLRVILHNHARNASKKRSRFYIHIPAAFDPAALLYPTLIPPFVALSLNHADVRVLLPNLMLGVASVPSKIIPLNHNVPWYSSMQWLLSVVPLSMCQQWYSNQYQDHMQVTQTVLGNLEAEKMVLLYPLHQALMPALRYLTTTSLLPAELQLLSVSMINLFIHSTSAQAVILRSLLWLGGLSLFILCGKVLSWGVALARIPSWRFRKPELKARGDNVIVAAIDDSFHGRLGRWGLISAGSGDSDSDDLRRLPNLHARKTHRPLHSVGIRKSDETYVDAFPKLSEVSQLVSGNGTQSGLRGANGTLRATQADLKRQRRYTVPSYVGSPSDSPPKETFKRSRTAQLQPISSWSLRSLTKAQALVVKWILALYVYTVVIAVVTLGIRPYIGRKALHDQEPVGWAIGYLLGDLPLFRSYTAYWDLEHWIRLPRKIPYNYNSKAYTWAQFCQCDLGAANVRLLICIYCLIIISAGLAVVFRLTTIAEVDTRRKVFHGMMMVMFLPTIFIDPTFISLAFVLTLAIFLLLDLFRASQLPPLSKPLTYLLAPYVDGRDHRGPVIVSHIFLLIGCGIPLWLSLAATRRSGEIPWQGWDVERREVSMVSGVVCVGMGDAAASLIGRRFGRRRWCWSGGKSLEGSLAFAVAVVLGLFFARFWLNFGGWDNGYRDPWTITFGKSCVAAIGASLTEAVLTGGNDNVIVPVILWLVVRGLRI